MNQFPLTGPGSQPSEVDGAELDILQLPSGMDTYSMPYLPEPEEIEGLDAALAVLDSMVRGLNKHHPECGSIRFDLNTLDEENRRLVDQVLGEGEVSIVMSGEPSLRIQESVLAGVWRIKEFDGADRLINDYVELGDIPEAVRGQTFVGAQAVVTLTEPLPEGVLNAPPLFAELNDAIANCGNNPFAHVINLTLLPQTEADLEYLQQRLGPGTVTILSRGYGNCRITSSGTQHVWWVQYFNSQDRNILNSLEITDVPNVACAAPEDIADSAERLEEILEIYR